MLTRYKRLVCALLLLPSCLWADNFLGVQPDAPRAADIEFYQQLADTLGEELGYDIKYVHHASWNEFRKAVFRNEFTILLIEPHVAAWTSRDQYKGGIGHLIVGTVDQMSTYIVVTLQDSPPQSLNDLLGKKVCSPHTSSLASVSLMNEVTDPVNPPTIVEVRGTAEQRIEKMRSQRCSAVILSTVDFERLRLVQADLRAIHTTNSYPGWTITTPRTQTRDDIKMVRELIADKNTGHASIKALQSIYTPADTQFIYRDEAYFEQFNVLPGVVWGW